MTPLRPFLLVLLALSPLQEIRCDPPVFPPEVVNQAKQFFLEARREVSIEGRVYTFDQATLEQEFERTLERLQKVSEKRPAEEKPWQEFGNEHRELHLARKLAYCLVAVGEFATANAKIHSLLDTVGDLYGNHRVPGGVTFPERQYFGAAAVSFKDARGELLDSSELFEEPRLMYHELVGLAKLKMAARQQRE